VGEEASGGTEEVGEDDNDEDGEDNDDDDEGLSSRRSASRDGTTIGGARAVMEDADVDGEAAEGREGDDRLEAPTAWSGILVLAEAVSSVEEADAPLMCSGTAEKDGTCEGSVTDADDDDEEVER